MSSCPRTASSLPRSLTAGRSSARLEATGCPSHKVGAGKLAMQTPPHGVGGCPPSAPTKLFNLKFIGRWICLCGELRPRGRREDVWGVGSGGLGGGGRQHGGGVTVLEV